MGVSVVVGMIVVARGWPRLGDSARPVSRETA
jgi:hypothetical protein